MIKAAESNLPPSRLYKYRSLAGKGLNYLNDILLRDHIWWASPTTFNDPYDCFPVLDFSGSDDEIEQFVTNQVSRDPLLNSNVRQQKIQSISKAMREQVVDSPEVEKGGLIALSQTAKEMGVLCLTENPADMLMWGHYACSHQGICLEFATQSSPFNLAHRIIYTDERSVFRVLDPDRSDLMERVLLRKAKVWTYEDEWRIFGPGTVGHIKFPENAITSVILGAKISPNHEENVREMLANRQIPVPIKRVEIDRYQYTLNLVDA